MWGGRNQNGGSTKLVCTQRVEIEILRGGPSAEWWPSSYWRSVSFLPLAMVSPSDCKAPPAQHSNLKELQQWPAWPEERCARLLFSNCVPWLWGLLLLSSVYSDQLLGFNWIACFVIYLFIFLVPCVFWTSAVCRMNSRCLPSLRAALAPFAVWKLSSLI